MSDLEKKVILKRDLTYLEDPYDLSSDVVTIPTGTTGTIINIFDSGDVRISIDGEIGIYTRLEFSDLFEFSAEGTDI